MSELTVIIQKLIAEGADPNDLQEEFEETVGNTLDWVLWGTGHWYKNMVCSKCGSGFAGLCSDDTKAKITDFKNPTFHKNQLGVKTIPYKEWIKEHPKEEGK